MMNEEMITKAKEVKTVEELIALAKENGVELNEEDAKMYFEQLNAKKGELSDDELDAVAGGGCETKVDGKEYTVVTSPCKCFTGQYLCNYEMRDGYWQLTDRLDHWETRQWWLETSGLDERNNKCGSCAHLGFKGGIGYCEKS